MRRVTTLALCVPPRVLRVRCFGTRIMASAAPTPADVKASLRHDLYINGALVPAAATFEVQDPSNGEVLAVSGAASVEQAHAAVVAAAAAFKTWSKTTGAERADWLRRLADEVTARRSRICIAESLNTGKPLREAEGDIDDCIACLRYCAGLAEKAPAPLPQPDAGALPDPKFSGAIEYEPVGVVAAITPFNFPLMMAGWKVGPALAAGCTIVVKPSEFTPFTTMELGAAAAAVGLPAGVLNIVTGDGRVGAALTEHPAVDKISFTGSGPTGSKVMAVAARDIKRCTLELGGKSPLVVHEDAEIDAAVEWTLFGCFFNAGQICSATARVLVHESIAEAFTARLVAGAQRIAVGTSFEEGVQMGPSCNGMQWRKVQAFIEKARAEGCTLLTGGGRPAGDKFASGFWTAPTIFGGVRPHHTLFREEVFGPVMSVTTFATEEESIALANDSEYGLAAAVFSRDEAKCKRFARAVRAGVVWVNNAQPSPHAMPWGGFKKSGVGRELGPLCLAPFLETKAVLGWPAGEGVGWYPEAVLKA